MAGKKGHKCWWCGQHKAHEQSGALRCQNPSCGAVHWSLFDHPYRGQSGKGFRCKQCHWLTMHVTATVADCHILRCSVCGSGMAIPTKAMKTAQVDEPAST